MSPIFNLAKEAVLNTHTWQSISRWILQTIFKKSIFGFAKEQKVISNQWIHQNGPHPCTFLWCNQICPHSFIHFTVGWEYCLKLTIFGVCKFDSKQYFVSLEFENFTLRSSFIFLVLKLLEHYFLLFLGRRGCCLAV